MTCPTHGTTRQRFITEEPATFEHGPGGQAFYECEICGHQDFISREDLEAEKGEWRFDDIELDALEKDADREMIGDDVDFGLGPIGFK